MSSVLKKARLNAANGGGVAASQEKLTSLCLASDGDSRNSGADDPRVSLLRESMRKHNLNGYLIETQDAHQSEYVADHDKRREWLTGFTGSAGTALVTETTALLWTDGRYFLQASQQLRGGWKLMRMGEQDVLTLEQWLARAGAELRDANVAADAKASTPGNQEKTDSVPSSQDRAKEGIVVAEKVSGFRLGVDPWLLSAGTARSLASKLAESSGSLVAISGNLVDAIWTDQPPIPRQPVREHPLKYAGVSVPDKLDAVRKLVRDAGASSLMVMGMDEVAWLYNIRGSDIPFNPVAFSGTLLTQDEALLFIDDHKLGDDVMNHLLAAGVTVRPYDAILSDLKEMYSPAKTAEGTPGKLRGRGRVLMDQSLNMAIREVVPPSLVLERASPIALAKAIKNDKELQGLRDAHIRDGVALTVFLSWLERAMAAGEAGEGEGVGWPLNEVTVAEKLEACRREQTGFVSLSFETIAGYGPNGAIIHYAANSETARPLGTDSLFLLDSGAQYEDGTTDVTRTVCFGEPTPHQRHCFTLVLKGHIVLARAVFPEDTMGSKLDVLARMALWEAGLDYRHGTGHGVGAFLNVHEGPHGIHCRIRPNEQGIKIGMTTSNEPGYYEDGQFGLRIENVCICVEKKTKHNFAGKRSCTFETITMAPIQTKLIDESLLTASEREWLDDYHTKVRDTLGPLLRGQDDEAYAYLLRQTRPLGHA